MTYALAKTKLLSLFILVGNPAQRSKSPSFQKSVGEMLQAITRIFAYVCQEKWEQDVSLGRRVSTSLILEMQGITGSCIFLSVPRLKPTVRP